MDFVMSQLIQFCIILKVVQFEQFETQEETFLAGYKVHSYYTAIALPCRYIDYFLPQVMQHHRISSLKMYLTFMQHRNAVTSQFLCSKGAVWQCNAIVAECKWTFTQATQLQCNRRYCSFQISSKTEQNLYFFYQHYI